MRRIVEAMLYLPSRRFIVADVAALLSTLFNRAALFLQLAR
jgi:hypothetical protein